MIDDGESFCFTYSFFVKFRGEDLSTETEFSDEDDLFVYDRSFTLRVDSCRYGKIESVVAELKLSRNIYIGVEVARFNFEITLDDRGDELNSFVIDSL